MTNLNITPTMEEISLYGNVLGSYSKHDSDLRLWGGDYEAESGSLKLFSPDYTLSYLNLIYWHCHLILCVILQIFLTSTSSVSCGGDGMTSISKTKAGGQFSTQYFVRLEQGSVVLKIKLQFFLDTITSDFHLPPRLWLMCEDVLDKRSKTAL